MGLSVMVMGFGRGYFQLAGLLYPAAVAAIAAVRHIFGAIRRDTETLRRRKGCCAACGYDMRATPDRCPECGAMPARRDGAELIRR
jgi:predicted Zn-ribbon and HTH transcriptional regulator